jgi:hypothetical protein
MENTLTEYDSTRYQVCCKATNDKDIDSLTKEVFNAYPSDSIIECKICDLLMNYFKDKGFKIIKEQCFVIFEKETLDNWLIFRKCQLYVNLMDKIEGVDFKSDELGTQVCYGKHLDEFNDWVYYLYTSNYPKHEILGILNSAKEIILNTPKDQLGELDENDHLDTDEEIRTIRFKIFKDNHDLVELLSKGLLELDIESLEKLSTDVFDIKEI